MKRPAKDKPKCPLFGCMCNPRPKCRCSMCRVRVVLGELQ